ncbi:MAG TPA: GNAT family N-acetyltransferase [Sphingomicrobium sp.]
MTAEGRRPGLDPGSSSKFTEAPTLETERLLLRQWRKEDFRPYHAILSHPEVHKHFGPSPMNAEEAWRRLTSFVGGWQFLGFGMWAVEEKASGKLVGIVGLFNAWRDLQPQFGEEPEMGWIMAAETHGKGLASEACDRVVKWAEASLAPTPIWAIIAPANEPSLRLAAKLGFETIGATTYHGDPTIVLRRPAWA